MKGENFISPVADGTVKISGEDQDLRTSTLFRDSPDQIQNKIIFKQNQTGLLQPHSWCHGEAKGVFWCLRRFHLPSSRGTQSLTVRSERRITGERYCGCFVGTSSTRGGCSSKYAWRSRSRLSRPSCQGQKWSCLLLRFVLQDALSKVTQIYPLLKLMVFVDDITAFFKGRNKLLAGKVMRNLKEEVEEKGLKLSTTENEW